MAPPSQELEPPANPERFIGFKIELPRRPTFANLLDMVAINSGEGVTVEGQAIRFSSRREVNFDEFGGHLCIDGQVAHLQLHTLRVRKTYGRRIEQTIYGRDVVADHS